MTWRVEAARDDELPIRYIATDGAERVPAKTHNAAAGIADRMNRRRLSRLVAEVCDVLEDRRLNLDQRLERTRLLMGLAAPYARVLLPKEVKG